jgi:hypothetical protein
MDTHNDEVVVRDSWWYLAFQHARGDDIEIQITRYDVRGSEPCLGMY